MCLVIRGWLGTVGAILLLACAPSAAVAQSADGPRVAFIRGAASIFKMEVGTIGLSGEAPRRLSASSGKGLTILDGLSFSADGSRLAFGSTSLLGGGGREGVYTVSSAGGHPRFVVGTRGGTEPVLSPDGETLAFARVRLLLGKGKRVRFVGSSVWLVDADGGRPRRMTPWRHRLVLLPSSFSPDGAILALSRRPGGKGRAVMGLRLADRSLYLIARGFQDAVFSPDGTHLAAMRVRPRPGGPRRQRRLFPGSDLFVLRADGTGRRRLTREPSAMKISPSWDPSGERLLYVRFPSKLSLASLFGFGSSVIEINADGTCRQRLIFEPEAAYLAAAWQPGAGREAGRISC